MRLLHRNLLQHAGLKIGALVIALALWVAYNSAPIVETGYSVPLLLENIPPGLQVTGEVPSTVLLRLRGHAGPMRRIELADLSVSADCSQTHAGIQNVRLTPNLGRSPNGPEIIRVTPEQVEISLVSASAPSPAQN